MEERKHDAQWSATLTTYAYPVLGNLSVADIETSHVVKVLSPIWITKHETARRVRQRLERILSWAAAAKCRPQGDNPASLQSLGQLLAKGKKIKTVSHHDAMPYANLPGLWPSSAGWTASRRGRWNSRS